MGVGCGAITDTPDCFARGTRIRTPSGTRRIEELRVGDAVLSFEPATMRVVVRRVTALHRALVSKFVTIEVVGRRIVTTDEHPFWEAERRAWTRAAEIQSGAVLAILESGILVPHTVDRVSVVETREPMEVFNLTVEGPEHTYFAEDVAVHNKTIAAPCGRNCTQTPPVDATALNIRNDETTAIDVEVLPLGATMAIDERVLTRELDIEIPSNALTNGLPIPKVPRFVSILPGRAEVVTQPSDPMIDILHGDLAPTKSVVAILRVGGQTAMYIGTGVLIPRRVDGVLRLAAEDSSRIRVVPIAEELAKCATNPHAVEFETTKTSELDQEFVVMESTHDAKPGCTQARIARGSMTGKQREISFCGAEDAWSFAIGDKVKLRKPKLLAGTLAPTEWLRVERADGRAFEIARVRRRSMTPLELGEMSLAFREDASCVLPLPPEASRCAALPLGSSVIDARAKAPLRREDALELPGGKAWITGASSVPFSYECESPSDAHFVVDVIARSSP
jgi:hypothetical protein